MLMQLGRVRRSADQAASSTSVNMKPRFLAAASLLTVLLSTAANLHAAEAVRLETRIYVLKGGDAHDIDIPGAVALDRAGSVTFRSPTVARFGDESVSLEGERFTWSGGRNPSDKFGRIETPDVVLANGAPAELLFT